MATVGHCDNYDSAVHRGVRVYNRRNENGNINGRLVGIVIDGEVFFHLWSGLPRLNAMLDEILPMATVDAHGRLVLSETVWFHLIDSGLFH